MKPLKLTMMAFGPYAGIQVVDFGQLQNRTFFLIHGPTGSGKTTILDAICFALYGDASGAERNDRHMRSHHADSFLATEVVFDFALGSKDIYRIRRRPEQERPKIRGEGTTALKAEAALWKRTGLPDEEDGVVLQTGWSKVTEAVENLLGFKSSQFRQVVMLPQGEFRKLLTDSSKEREAILETLFKTEYYRRIEEALKDSAKKLKESVEMVERERNWVFQEAKAKTGEELKERCKTHQEQYLAIEKEVEESRQSVKEAGEKLASAKQIKEKLKERKDAETALAEQVAIIEAIDLKRSDLAKGRQAATLLDAETSMLTRRKEAADSYQYLVGKKQQAEAAINIKAETDHRLNRLKEKEPERETLRIKFAKLDEMTGKVAELTLAGKEAAKKAQEVKLAENAQARAKENHAHIQNYILQKSQERDKALEQMAQEATLEAELKKAEQTFKKRGNLDLALKELKPLRQELALAQEKLETAENDCTKKREEYSLIQDAWHKGQAAILAKNLTAGIPCPVCGSLHHPLPALSDASLPSEDDLKTKEIDMKRLETVREEIRKKTADLTAKAAVWQSKISELEQELGEKASESLGELQKMLLESQRRWKTARQALADYPALNAELEEMKEKEKKAKEQLEGCSVVLQVAKVSLEAAKATVKEREIHVPENLRDPAYLQQAQQQAKAERDRAVSEFEQAKEAAAEKAHELAKAEAAVVEAKETYESAEKRAKNEEQSFQQRLLGAGFPGQEDYHAAKKDRYKLQILENEVKEFDENLKAARDRLDRAAQRAEGLNEPDIERLAKAQKEAETALKDLLNQSAELQTKVKQETDWLKNLVELSRQLQDLEENYTVWGYVSDVANGKNNNGITFQRFIQGAMLDDVCIAATERLKLMSRGRYHLQRTMDRSRKNAAGGLDLVVFDVYTGLARPVTTLSGGETFLASLSLALGLADVVQAYSGGIYLDTIFVDEGFGTLDPESLDFAIKTLLDLQKGGRLVGIISHVPELKERIDARLEVRPTNRGSSAGFVLS